jgi:pyruvate dehydrogenase E1 component
MVLQQIRRSLVSSGQAKLRCQSVLHPTAFRALGVAADRSPEVLMTHFRDILNKNADSTKSLQELSNDWFQQATGEKKGLDSSELATLMERLGLQLRGGEKDAFFRYFDENNSGSVTYNEFTQAIRGAMPKFAASLAFMDQHRGHYPSAMLSVRSALPRFELSETDEWLESLDALLQHHGPRRARFLLQELTDEAVRRGVRMSSTITTPMINTIPATVEPEYPGDLNIEKRISNLVRWNAAVMVSDGNKRAPGVGGHIGTFASVCDIWEVGQQHFFRGKGAGGGMGDQIYLQGHAAPGAYARAYLEGRLSLEQIMNFRQEVGGKGISSYPHPRLMPDFWENPTVSMGIGPLQAVCQARFFRYLHLRGLADTSGSRVWCFIGDGEMDEPESIYAIARAGYEKLNNLIYIVNCNYQRLDGPVRGNSKVIQEFEGVFRGAGFDCIKLIWGDAFCELVENDHDGRLIEALELCPDGDCQRFAAKQDGGLIRRELFEANGLGDRVEHLTDEELLSAFMVPGGHDKKKIYAAMHQAATNAETGGRPTVILAKTLKGFSLATFQGRNTVHQQKTMKNEEMLGFRDVLDIPLTDEQIANPKGGEFFRKPDEDSVESKYLKQRREALGGYLPSRVVPKISGLIDLPGNQVYQMFDKGNTKAMSTTMAFAGLLKRLMKEGEFGSRCVPMVTDEARTFGMNPFFSEFKIHAPFGQQYTPVDHDQMLKYSEAPDGQVLQEGISEAGALCTWIATGTSYASQGCPMMPFFIYYSMFGFQRVGDFIWQGADARARGFLLGATAGRTTLNGEGLQHQDGHSLLMALTNPAVKAWDPAFAYELSYIIQHGIQEMWGEDKDVIYYISLYNENHPMPALPEDPKFKDGLLKGLYKFKAAEKKKHTVRILASGSVMQEALKAIDLLAEYDVGCEIWSVTNYGELNREAVAAERYSRLHPQEKPRSCWVKECLNDYDGVTIAVSDNMSAVPEMLKNHVNCQMTVLGTDGFGRSDTREALRSFFEIDSFSVTVAALSGLSRKGQIKPDVVLKAMEKFGVKTERTDITV